MLVFAQQVVETLGGSSHPDTVLARQMQALSLTVHIPIVCFGIAFPAMFVFVEGLYLRTGNVTYKALAKRWSKVALILFAVGVVTGTILSFEFGLLWPNFMATFGDVFGIAFGLEGISFFVEAIFIAIYVYGWDRLSPRAHFLTGIPVVIAGFTGSFNVIAVNGWMNTPDGFEVVDGKVVEPAAVGRAVQHRDVARADPHVPGRLPRLRLHRRRRVRVRVAAREARPLPPHRARRDAGVRLRSPRRCRSSSATGPGRSVAENQPVKLAAFEGLQETTAGAPFTFGGHRRDPEDAVDPRLPRPERRREGARHGAARATARRSRSCGSRSRRWSSIGTALALLGVVFFFTWLRLHRLPRSKWFYRAVMVAGPLSFVALIAGWIVDRGRPPAVDRLRGDAHRRRR